MIQLLEAVVKNDTYQLSHSDWIRLIQMQGVGLPPIRLIKEKGPQQHGSTVVDTRYDERMITIAWILWSNGASEADIDGYRDDLARILKTGATSYPIKFRVTRDDGEIRMIHTHMVGETDFPISIDRRMGASQIVMGQFEASDPFWYNPALRNVTFQTVGQAPGWEIPSDIPFLQNSGGSINGIETITYLGNRRTYPTIFITGPAEDVVITNLTTNRVLDFTGATLTSGEIYTVTLGYNENTIVSSVNGNKIDALTSDSDLTEWYIAAHPEADEGINDIEVVATNTTDVTRVRVEYYDRFVHL